MTQTNFTSLTRHHLSWLWLLPVFALGLTLAWMSQRLFRPPEPPRQSVIELPEMRTLTSKTYIKPDNTLRTVFSAGPMHYQDANGQLLDISAAINSSSADPDYQIANLSNIFQTWFAARSDSEYLVKVAKDNQTMEIGAIAIEELGSPQSVQAEVGENYVLYPNLYPGVDLKYTITELYFRIEYLVHDQDTALKLANLTQKFKLTGLEGRLTNGSLTIYDDLDQVWTELKEPWMSEYKELVDADGNWLPAESIDGVDLLLDDWQEGVYLTKNINLQGKIWLADSDREYPVTIDPTIIFYPDPTTGGSGVDGWAQRFTACESFSNLRNGTGSGQYTDYTNYLTAQVHSSTCGSNLFYISRRGHFFFNTASLADDATINSATLSLYGYTRGSGLGWPDMAITGSSTSNTNTLANSDYQLATYSSLGSITWASYNTSGYNDISVLTSSVSLTGTSRYVAITSWERDDNFTGTWAADASSHFGVYFADQTGTSQDPKLTVDYSLPATPTPAPSGSFRFEGVRMEGLRID